MEQSTLTSASEALKILPALLNIPQQTDGANHHLCSPGKGSHTSGEKERAALLQDMVPIDLGVSNSLH